MIFTQRVLQNIYKGRSLLCVLTDVSGSSSGQQSTGSPGSGPAPAGGSDRISQLGLALQPSGGPQVGRQRDQGGRAKCGGA